MKTLWAKLKCKTDNHDFNLVDEHEIVITGGTLVDDMKNIRASRLNGTRPMKKDWKSKRCGHERSTIQVPGIAKSVKV